jgi:hypothetical protein
MKLKLFIILLVSSIIGKSQTDKIQIITVVEIIIDNKGELTEQGKKHKATKDAEKSQTKLDLDSEE